MPRRIDPRRLSKKFISKVAAQKSGKEGIRNPDVLPSIWEGTSASGGSLDPDLRKNPAPPENAQKLKDGSMAFYDAYITMAEELKALAAARPENEKYIKVIPRLITTLELYNEISFY